MNLLQKGGMIMKTAAKTTLSSLSEIQAPQTPYTATHQGVAGFLYTEISVYLKAREPKCRIMAAPFAVFLKIKGRICLLPDIAVVQDEGKIDEEGCHGAPDWVIEVVSSSSREADYGQKLGIYINTGVREYWIVDPEKKLIVVYCLEHPDVPGIYHFGDIIKSDIYPDLIIDSSQLDHIQYQKAADIRNSMDEGMAASLAAAVKKALSETDSPDAFSDSSASISTDLMEDIITEVLSAAKQQADTRHLTYPEDSAAEGQDMPEAFADPAEVKSFILEHLADFVAAGNKGQLMKAAMSALKGRAESRLVNEAVAELLKEKNNNDQNIPK